MTGQSATTPADNRFDVIVIGGGIYGVMTALESSSRGLKTLLVEAGDWCSGTSYSWLRILHGGLRYLQTMDLPRFYESVRERSWFLEHFPHLVRPISCIMPLYQTGSHPVWMMRAALTLNDVLSIHRNRRLVSGNHLERERMLSPDEVQKALPYIERAALKGGARWQDAVAFEPQLLFLELLQWCRAHGAVCLNYTQATGVLTEGGKVTGITCAGASDGEEARYQAPVVINAAGHWAPGLARKFGHAMNAEPGMSWAWNVLFDLPVTTDCAGAVTTARKRGRRPSSSMPWQGRMLVGTGHAPVRHGDESAPVPEHLVAGFVEQVAKAVPSLGLGMANVSRVLGGRLPISSPEPIKLTARPVIVDHQPSGAAGLYSVWGIKYTTALAVARRVVDKACGRTRAVSASYRPDQVETGQLPLASLDRSSSGRRCRES